MTTTAIASDLFEPDYEVIPDHPEREVIVEGLARSGARTIAAVALANRSRNIMREWVALADANGISRRDISLMIGTSRQTVYSIVRKAT